MTVRTYNNYLKIDELLSLQQPVSEGPEHDEMLFIVIHQVYELWFKQILWEFDWLRGALEANERPRTMATLKRILTILKTLVGQIDVLETMTPVDFSSFRSRLDSASGFQSVQFREVELVLGHRREGQLDHVPAGGPERARLETRLRERTVYDSFLRFLAANGHPVPAEVLDRDVTQAPAEDQRVRAILVGIYRRDPALRETCERLVDLDEGIQEWRYRHVKMVQRTIGTKRGTGGSAGAEYLRNTLFQPLFPDLWAIRTEL
ncbi:MAG TPA: tryptophan 2,3-dioxygenase family protein [Thermoanaerobaculia bacterium]|nr:tryptophan 2,3-dioxygenase family protein [Thermoanaerobaculia bacterium]